MTEQQPDKQVLPTQVKKDPNKKYIFLGVLSFIAVIIIILLSINFNYKIKSTLNSSQNNSKSPYINPVLPKISADTQVNNNNNLIEKEETKPNNKNNQDKERESSCKQLLSFIQEYFNLKMKIAQSKNYTEELMKLKDYKIESVDVSNHLDELASLVDFNYSKEYFRDKFKPLIKEIYLNKYKDGAFLTQYIKQVFFIRPIGNRAIAKGGNDKEIVLCEKALYEGDLSKAIHHIKAINNSDNLINFIDFKTALENKLKIKENIEYLDKLFINKLNCSEVSR